ncbi:DUF397 domain-containing protein [Nocardia sp. NPDC003693]
MNIDWPRAHWRKSTHSGGSGGDCVEVAFAGGSVGVRDSKNPGPVLVFAPGEWDAFTAGVVQGAFNVSSGQG